MDPNQPNQIPAQPPVVPPADQNPASVQPQPVQQNQMYYQAPAQPQPQAYPQPIAQQPVPQPQPGYPQPAYNNQPIPVVSERPKYVPVILIIGLLFLLLVAALLLGDLGNISELKKDAKRVDADGIGVVVGFAYFRVIPVIVLLVGYGAAVFSYFRKTALYNKLASIVFISGAWLLTDTIIRGLILQNFISSNNLRSKEAIFNPVSLIIGLVMLGLGFVVWRLPHKNQRPY